MERLSVENAPQWRPKVVIVSITPDPEGIIEMAYRNCWQSKPKVQGIEARRSFIKKCINGGHLAPLEFALATFVVEGSRIFTHQQVRHRIASYAQESQRYVEVDGPNYVIVPPRIHAHAKALAIFVEAINKAWEAYKLLLELGMPREDARFVLPNATKSKIFVGMNFRSWRHFLKLRCDKSAQWEIRGVAREILKILYEHAPGVFGDLYEKFILHDGEGELWTERD